MASAATRPISSAPARMMTSIYLLAVKRSCPGSDVRAGVTASDGTTFPDSRSSMTTTGDNGIEPLGHDGGDVVGDDQLARGDLVALADVGREALALQRDGVQSQVDQHAHVVGRHDDVGVRHQLQQLAADRSDRLDHPARRIDRGAVAHHALGEHGVGHVAEAERHAPRRGRGLVSCSLS